MQLETGQIDSTTEGNPKNFRNLQELHRGLEQLPSAPRDAGTVKRLVSRGPGGLRHLPARAQLTQHGGMPDDAWARRDNPNPEAQVAVMQWEIANLICNGQPLELAGDNLFLDLDLSARNLPTGSQLQVGGALMEVTPKPHNGCKKFRARFGEDALRFAAAKDLRHLNLRGIYLRVLADGEVAVGDGVRVLSRGPALQKSTSAYTAVLELVRQIPPGKVMTYGQIATLLGSPRGARAVGYAMFFSGLDDVPWHRVINAKGEISLGGHADRPIVQRQMLQAEGVEFTQQGRIDLASYLWQF